MPGAFRYPSRNILISGGAGCIGTTLAAHLLATTTTKVTLLYDRAAPGADQNLAWLQSQADPARLQLVQSDCRGATAVEDADEIYDLAHCTTRGGGQSDRDRNTRRTRELLEAASHSPRNPVVVFASTSYTGAAAETAKQARLVAVIDRQPAAEDAAAAAASLEQLVQDVAHIYGVPAVALRFDTVAGPRQFDEQGDWLARLVYVILSGAPLAVPPAADRVHDILHVADAIDAMLAARAYIGITAGKVYNVGGGNGWALSLEDVIHRIESACGCTAQLLPLTPQPQEQSMPQLRTWPFRIDTGWRARRSVEEALRDMAAFWKSNFPVLRRPPAEVGSHFPQAA